MSGLHLTHVGSIERREKSTSIETLVKVAKGLNIEVADLCNFRNLQPDVKKMKRSFVEDINTSSPKTIKILSDLLSGLKSLQGRSG
jgi:EAL domain-containing protein (putative c-di-GMP-specific phosphodiesterase class I)